MTLRERVPITIVVEGFAKYRAKQHDIVGLAQALSQAMSLLEGDIPGPVREAIVQAEAHVDTIRFFVNEKREADEVDKIWQELQETLSRHGALGPQTST